MKAGVLTATTDFWTRLESLDLGPIKYKLTHTDGGVPWTREKVERVEIFYRAFLFLSHHFPEESIVPTREIDEFWHAHILDTHKYAADCLDLFGGFLHHFPYFGIRSEEDAAALKQAFDRTKALFMSECGINLDGTQSGSECTQQCTAGECGSECGSKCGSERTEFLGRPTWT